jgi:hypothetical protein
MTMTTLSSAGWVVHDVGLAASIGGTLFGRAALQPALSEISRAEERDRVSAEAWQRFSWVNLASHLAFAVPWLVGRRMRTGREVSGAARALTLTKDVLVGASLISGVSSVVLGRRLGERARRGLGPAQTRQREIDGEERQSRAYQRAVGVLGIVNLIANVAIAGVTALLAMEGSKSARFAASSRRLP